MLYTVDEILEYTFIVYERDSGTLKELPLQREFAVYLSNWEHINLMVLYNPEDRRRKLIASNYLSGDEMIKA